MTHARQPCFALLLLFSTAPACDGSGDDGVFATEPGASVLTAAIDAFVVDSKGDGLDHPFPPAGAACRRYQWRYTLMLETGELSWDRCAVAGSGTEVSDYTPESGSRTLTSTGRETALEALRAVRVSARRECGADKSTVTVEVRAGTSSLTYGDDFYGCHRDHEHYAEWETVSDLGAALHALAGD